MSFRDSGTEEGAPAEDSQQAGGRRARVGQAGEAAAAQFLRAQGLVIIERNWRCRAGEIDLVARDGPALVFVEVKTRRGQRFGTGAEAVDGRKQQRLRRLALIYLGQRGELDQPCRFDVIAISVSAADGQPTVEWIRDAF